MKSKKAACRRSNSAVLIVEAIIASFLMIFAFIAATQLFDASLRWESTSANDRIAALVAERRMEELRGWVDRSCTTSGFEALNWANQEVTDAEYPESPGFLVTVKTDRPTYTAPRLETARVPTPPGFHSPSSQLYAVADAGKNAQRSEIWLTYPYSRDMSQSLKRVQVTVKYGSQSQREYVLVSFVSDAIAPPHDVTPATFPTLPVVISGPGSLGVGTPEVYTVQVKLPNNQVIKDVTALWSVAPTSTASAILKPLDAGGQRIEVSRSPFTLPGSGAKLRLLAKVRYRGREIVGYSSEIAIP